MKINFNAVFAIYGFALLYLAMHAYAQSAIYAGPSQSQWAYIQYFQIQAKWLFALTSLVLIEVIFFHKNPRIQLLTLSVLNVFFITFYIFFGTNHMGIPINAGTTTFYDTNNPALSHLFCLFNLGIFIYSSIKLNKISKKMINSSK